MDEQHIEALEQLLNVSSIGHHHLFDHEEIKKILKNPTNEAEFFSNENVDRIQELFGLLLKKETLPEKRAFIERLTEKEYEMLVRSYFHILETNLNTSQTLKH